MLRSAVKEGGGRYRVTFRYPPAKELFIDSGLRDVGGAPVQIYTLATELAKDPDIDVCLWVDGRAPKERIDGVRLLPGWRETSRFNLPARLLNKLRVVRAARVAARGLTIFTVQMDADLARLLKSVSKRGGKTAYRVASELVFEAPGPESLVDESFATTLRAFDVVLAQTRTQQVLLEERFGVESRLVHSAFPVKESIVSRGKKNGVLWVGQCLWYKRPWIVIEAARALSDIPFVMIMPQVDRELATALLDQMQHLENLSCIDFVPFAEVQSYYDSSRLVLNTSLFEGYPNTLNQSAQARSVYISLKWNADDVLGEGGMGFCCENDTSYFIATIERLYHDTVLQDKVGEQAFQMLKKDNSLEAVMREYQSLVRELL